MASKSEVLRRAPVCVRWGIPWERGRLARILIPANSLPSTATPLQGAPNPPLRGALPSCRGLCGRDARAPRGSFFTSRSASTASMAKGGADGRNDQRIDRLAGGRIRARWRSWQVTGWRRSPKCCGGLLFVFGGQSTRERGRPARILIPANSLPSKATPLQGAPNPPLRGSLPSCRSLCGRDARAPGWGLCGRDARAPRWGLCGRDARAPGGSFFTSRSASTASMAKGGADGRNDHQIDRLAGGGIRARWRSWHVTGWRRSPKCCGGLLFVFGGQSTRERGRPARILIPANSLPSKATPLQGAPNPPLRGSLPSCQVLCGRDARAPGWSLCGRDARAPGGSLCGRDARAPGWGLCGRDARAPRWSLCGRDARAPRWGLLLPPARPLAGPSRASSNALVALWPFLVALRGYLFLSLGVLRGCPWWVLYVSWLCSSATISRATSRPRSGWPGGREMAATTGWPPPP